MSQRGFAPILIILFLAMLVGVSFIPLPYYQGRLLCKVGGNCPTEGWHRGSSIFQMITSYQSPQMELQQTACTLEAKLCPDGKSVARTGPNCEFSACPTQESTSSANTSTWKTYTNTKYAYSIQYPSDKNINCSHDEDEFRLYDGGEGTRICALGEEFPVILLVHRADGIGDVDRSHQPDCYSIKGEPTTFAWVEGMKYTRVIKNDQGPCASYSSYQRHNVNIVLRHKNNPYIFLYNEYLDKELKNQILSTFKFLP